MPPRVRPLVAIAFLVACSSQERSSTDGVGAPETTLGSAGNEPGTSTGDEGAGTGGTASGSAGGSSTGTVECQLTDECVSDQDCPDAIEFCIDCACVADMDQAVGDPTYPDPSGGCGGAFDGNSVSSPAINTCVLACDGAGADIDAACPDPATGNARGLCLIMTTQGASGAPCSQQTWGDACEMPGEFCSTSDGAEYSCRIGTYCVPSCANGESCPDAMGCDANGFCVY